MKTITASELKKKLDKDEVLLIDVRGPAEHRSECIDGAFLIPLGEISIDKLPSTKRPIVIHCRSGKRSADACAKLLASTPSLDVASLEGGIVAWSRAGFNVKKSGSTILPLDQQTQIATGFIVFSGTILGTLINPTFYILPGFIGAGLMFAGLTGWCGMAKLLAKMPWNR
ncbi:inner membrane protein YgaP [Holospora obtusa F1]|uniref:Inner membrane protein YgaP n=1 Tax=Holospora obtusa F1 TaxID=1399147 RepID=W6TGK7_HOLOB|nr:rhodanese-like domain-containing protein [Holospora obtusa]ETZ07030.1 inner membrane protein YgaP [Holospora obtusa F1]